MRWLLVVVAYSMGATASGVVYQPWCETEGLPKGTGAVICSAISAAATRIFNGTLDGNFSLLIGQHGRRRVHAKWQMEPNSVEVIASASKWLSAAAILRWLDSSGGQLRQPLQQYVPWWRSQLPVDPRLAVSLREVLSQTDGFGETLGSNFSEDGPTIFAKDYANLAVPQKIFSAVPIERYSGKMTGFQKHPSPYTWGVTPYSSLPRPGEAFYYEETHWRLAAAVVAAAGGGSLDNVTAELADALGMKNSKLENIPQLGGPEWLSTSEDLEQFLQAVAQGELLSANMQTEFRSDQTENSTWFGFRMRPEWGYALGSWAHCPDKSCAQFSSIGIFGTFPFVDYETGIYYALVRPAGLDPTRGVFLDRSVSFWEETWPTVRDALMGVEMS